MDHKKIGERSQYVSGEDALLLQMPFVNQLDPLRQNPYCGPGLFLALAIYYTTHSEFDIARVIVPHT